MTPSETFSCEHDPETGCWNWTGYIDKKGYARAECGQASRVVWRKLVGEIPAGHHLHHLCRNTACVNPAHLEPKPAGKYIAEHHRALTLDQARAIRELGRTEPSLTVIAAKSGVSISTAWKVLEGYHYKDLGGPVKPEGVTCGWCGGPVVGRQRRARYCCDDHRVKANSWRGNERKRQLRAAA